LEVLCVARRINSVSGPALFASFSRLFRPNHHKIHRFTAGTALSLALLIGSVSEGGNAIANGDSRTLSLYHTHTGESLTIEYKKNGSFDRDALEKLNWLLRDYHRDEPTSMDPRLFDIVWEAQRQVGSTEPINVVSAYRSPETNAMLRRRSKAVAKNSQHMLGKAMDFYLTDATITQIREVALKMQRGGVGYYPNAFTPFVHLDAGSVRHWPRMSHDELARLFPDGKTVHIPADGHPLERYAEAEQEILANGGTVMGASYADAGENAAPEPKTKSFWAALFGGGGSEDEDSEVVTQKPAQRVASTKSAAPVADTSDNGDASAENGAPEPKAALPKQPAMVAMPALSSFRMAVLAPNAPFPPSRPGAPVGSLVAMASNGPQLVWQTGPQALGGAPVPLPPMRNGMAPAAIASLASQPVPLPPMRGQSGRNGTPFALATPDGAEVTGSLGGNRSDAALPKIIADGRRPQAPTELALAYVATAPASATAPDDGKKPLPANAVAASKLALSGKSTEFSSAEDLGPPTGHFSKKSPAACRAGKSGQACMPSAER
jgi:uncharacterized protein YcbK (DUF882 family)